MEWKTIKIKDTWLLVSSFGLVEYVATRKPVILFDSNGYLAFKIYGAGTIYAHRLVLELFVPRVVGKNITNHVNHIKKDNRASNLEWVDGPENLKAFQLFKETQPDMATLIHSENYKRKHALLVARKLKTLMNKAISGYEFKWDESVCQHP